VQTIQDTRVLVTGGASGIGKAIAQRFARDRAHMILLDLNEAALAEAASTMAGAASVATYRADVTDAAALRAVRDRIHADGGPIDILINNAGLVFGGPFLDVPLEKHAMTFRVNVEGLVAMTHIFLPDLIGRPDAHIVNIASASGYIGLPFGTTYAASKWAVIGFSESLRLELEQLGRRHVHVTTMCPSYVSTGLFDGARPPMFTAMLTAERLADKTVRAVLSNRETVRTPWLVAVTPLLKGVLPSRAFYVVAGMLGATKSMSQWKGRL
jgi:all-trans-retinol dehydrogenase (NAD+)